MEFFLNFTDQQGWVLLLLPVFSCSCLCLSHKREPGLQRKSENHEHLKYVWNVNHVLTTHQRDLQPWKPQKTVSEKCLPSVTEPQNI